jgi:hypothetical protein
MKWIPLPSKRFSHWLIESQWENKVYRGYDVTLLKAFRGWFRNVLAGRGMNR